MPPRPVRYDRNLKLARQTALIAAMIGLRLVGLAGMRFAIGRTGFRLMPAEVELVLRRIADGPAAHAVVDRENGDVRAVLQGHGIFLDHRRLRDVSAQRGHAGRGWNARAFGAGGRRAAGEAEAM